MPPRLKGAFLVAQVVKNMPAMQETQVQSLGQEDPLEKGMATHSSILAWRIPWTRNLVGCGPRGRRGSDTTELLSTQTYRWKELYDSMITFPSFWYWVVGGSEITNIWRRKWQSTPVLLPGKSHAWRSLVGYSP